MKAHAAFHRRAVTFFHPNRLAIGIAAHEVRPAGLDRWNAYVKLHRAVYRALKRDHPELPVFASFALHTLLNQPGKRRDGVVRAFAQIMRWNDILAVSFNLFIQGGTTDIRGALDGLFAHFDGFRKPYAVAGTGEAADELAVAGIMQTIHGSPSRRSRDM